MNLYELSTKEEDEIFLKGQPLVGRVTLPKNQTLHENEPLVIRLSTGKTYKGKVLKLNLVQVDGYQFGEM